MITIVSSYHYWLLLYSIYFKKAVGSMTGTCIRCSRRSKSSHRRSRCAPRWNLKSVNPNTTSRYGYFSLGGQAPKLKENIAKSWKITQ